MLPCRSTLSARTGIARGGAFEPQGIERQFWSDASPVRATFRKAFDGAGLPYLPPHSFRHTLGHLAQTMCRTPEELKAWSQNLGHENVATTLTSYGKIDPHRQGEVIGQLKGLKPICLRKSAPLLRVAEVPRPVKRRSVAFGDQVWLMSPDDTGRRSPA